METKILLLEDDESLLDGLCYLLRKNGYAVETAKTVKEAAELLHGSRYDLLLLDVTLPDGTGFELCERERNGGSQVPIIFLTASDEEVNIIRGLDSGGDDYVTKPFKMGELLSRIHALLRRAGIQKKEDDIRIASGDLVIDLAGSKVTLRGEKLDLTGMEYRLLCLLVRSGGKVITRDIILNELWDGAGNFVDDNTLSVYIRRLREKIEADPSRPEHLLTVRGFGYCWKI
ncbi:MAG: response regulator transcription factor [Lachnospiraceae bacterium]|nr:response regulator transcription factor [Lachnospiraceae bacterium]